MICRLLRIRNSLPTLDFPDASSFSVSLRRRAVGEKRGKTFRAISIDLGRVRGGGGRGISCL